MLLTGLVIGAVSLFAIWGYLSLILNYSSSFSATAAASGPLITTVSDLCDAR